VRRVVNRVGVDARPGFRLGREDFVDGGGFAHCGFSMTSQWPVLSEPTRLSKPCSRSVLRWRLMVLSETLERAGHHAGGRSRVVPQHSQYPPWQFIYTDIYTVIYTVIYTGVCYGFGRDVDVSVQRIADGIEHEADERAAIHRAGMRLL
jgi:hypothetical protein